MSFLPEPDPVVLFFFSFRQFLFLPLLALLALLRTAVARGPSRLAALAALALALAGIATTLAPLTGLNQGPVYVTAARTMALGGGVWPLLVPAALMAASGLLPGARWRVLDAIFALLLAALLGLWWWTS